MLKGNLSFDHRISSINYGCIFLLESYKKKKSNPKKNESVILWMKNCKEILKKLFLFLLLLNGWHNYLEHLIYFRAAMIKMSFKFRKKKIKKYLKCDIKVDFYLQWLINNKLWKTTGIDDFFTPVILTYKQINCDVLFTWDTFHISA